MGAGAQPALQAALASTDASPATVEPAHAREEGASPAVAQVLDMQRLAGNRATVRAFSRRRSLEDPAVPWLVIAAGPAGPPVVQRLTGFKVEHKTRRYEQTSDVLAFDRLQTALDADELDKIPRLVSALNHAGRPIGLRAFASEDGGTFHRSRRLGAMPSGWRWQPAV